MFVAAQKYLGHNELAYRRLKEREAIFACDNGAAAPLYASHLRKGRSVSATRWGETYGTEVRGAAV